MGVGQDHDANDARPVLVDDYRIYLSLQILDQFRDQPSSFCFQIITSRQLGFGITHFSPFALTIVFKLELELAVFVIGGCCSFETLSSGGAMYGCLGY